MSSQSPRVQLSVRNRRGSPVICGATTLSGRRIEIAADVRVGLVLGADAAVEALLDVGAAVIV